MVVRSLRAVLFLLSALTAIAFTLVAARTLTLPSALDPVEVVALERAARFAQGQPLYVEPAHPDEPSLMPGFPVAVSLLARVFGPDLRQPRIITFLATMLIALAVLAIVRLETESWTLSVSSVGYLLLGYGLLGEPPGVARPETLMLLLALLGFLALRLSNGVAGALLGAVLLSSAFFTGSQAGWFIAAAMIALALDGRSRPIAFGLATGILVAGGHVLLSRALGPWFNFDVWDAPARLLRPSALSPLHYVGDQLLGRFSVLTLAAVLSFAMPTPPWRGKGGLWMCLGIAALAAGLASTQSAGFGPAALIPTVVALALLGPISMQRVTRHLSAWPGSTRLAGQGVVLAALTLQFLVFLSCVSTSGWLPRAGGAPRPVPPSVATEARTPERAPGT